MHPRSAPALFVLLGMIACALPLSAQPGPTAATGGRWEIEIHGGGAVESNPTGGTASQPPAGESFTTFTGRPSRRASSWYFGDGALLMNQIIASFVGSTATGRITPLDVVLNRAAATRNNDVSLGFRVARAITPRLTAEFNLDAPSGPLKLTDELIAGVEASRASFIPTWDERTGLISTGGGFVFTNPSVSSASTITDEQGRRIFSTGALTVNFPTGGRLTPYATIGAGVVSNIGDAPSVTLVGNYRFTSLNAFGPSSFPVNETDTIEIRLVPANNHPFVTVFGGGARIAGSPRWGVRADIRAYVSKNTFDVLVDATPQVATSIPAGFIASTTAVGIQFSNNPSTGRQSTLSGPAIDGFKTFSSSGTAMHVSISGGYFFRF